MPTPTRDYNLTILEHHLDTFGHVNNATYLALFEEARWELIHQAGYGLEEIRRSRLGPVILEAHLSFKRELTLRKRVTIKTSVDSYAKKIGKMTQLMADDEGNLCCEAAFVFGLFHLDHRRLVDPTPAWLAAMGMSPDGL